jgi:hypothetical protein
MFEIVTTPKFKITVQFDSWTAKTLALTLVLFNIQT